MKDLEVMKLETVYDLVTIISRIVIALTIIPLGIDEWKSLIERK